jgi:hypothetical protein
MRSATNHGHRQDGAVIVTTALMLLFLLGFMGIALDFGRLFVVKTELQTAMDSCALAAAQELDGTPGATGLNGRATNAGKTAGNMNKVHFQSSSAGIVESEIIFSDTLNGAYSNSFPSATAKYAKCTHTKSGMTPWLLKSMSAFTGNNSYAANQGVFALAVATRASAQSSCAIPVQINPKGNGTNFGFTPGEWIPSLYDEGNGNSDTTPGHFGWANLNGSSSAADTKNQLLGTGACDLHVDDTSTPGAKFGASTAWNSRFGLYKNGAGNPDIASAPPDLTGYSYTATNWPPVSPGTLPSNALPDFLAKRATFRSYGNTADSVNTGDTITGLNMKGGYKDTEMATYAAGSRALSTNGKDRRLVLAPIVTGTKITAFACILILHPIDSVNTTVYLEYVGNAASPSSPCTSLGLAGGTGGPLVPVLVQ